MSDIGFEGISHEPIVKKIATKVVNRVFPKDIEYISKDGLQKATEHVHNRGGLIVAFTHFTGREGIDVATWLREQPEFKDKEIVSPVSWHTYMKGKAGYDKAGELLRVKFIPIVTPETMALNQGVLDKLGAFPNEGLREYLQTAGEVLKKGGIVMVAPQGEGNTGSLGDPTPALSALIKTTGEDAEINTGILFVGLEIPGATPETMKREGALANLAKMHMLKRIKFRIGNFFTRDEAIESSKTEFLIKTPEKKIRPFDLWGFKQLAILVSPQNVASEYLQNK